MDRVNACQWAAQKLCFNTLGEGWCQMLLSSPTGSKLEKNVCGSEAGRCDEADERSRHKNFTSQLIVSISSYW